jgi:hypothetical protein|tara:strand:+ start:570 stop:776 length:207 start_codon:yes stop_codon:yes gene_type:complete
MRNQLKLGIAEPKSSERLVIEINFTKNTQPEQGHKEKLTLVDCVRSRVSKKFEETVLMLQWLGDAHHD